MKKNDMKIYLCILFVMSTGFNACVGDVDKAMPKEKVNISNKQENISSQERENKLNEPDSHEKKVSLEVIDISSEKVIIELSNNTNSTLYLFYDRKFTTDHSVNAYVFHYLFECKEKGKKEFKDYEPNSHSIVGLEPLEKTNNFRFEISPVPKINASCKVGLSYFDDKKFADLINNKILDLTEEEIRSIDKARKFTEDLKFEIGTNQ